MKPDVVLESIEAAALRQGWPIVGPKRGVILDEVVERRKPSSILEVGTNVGYSAIRMARHLKPGQKLTCIEISEEMARTARVNFEKAGLQGYIEVIVGDALFVLPTLAGSFDMVFLDAVKVDYLAYLKSVERLLHAGSVVVADNVKPYLDYVRRSGAYSSACRDAPSNWGADKGDAVEISIRL